MDTCYVACFRTGATTVVKLKKNTHTHTHTYTENDANSINLHRTFTAKGFIFFIYNGFTHEQRVSKPEAALHSPLPALW